MPKKRVQNVESKAAHDASRQKRAALVRLSEDEVKGANRLRKRGETIPALLRRLLNERMEGSNS